MCVCGVFVCMWCVRVSVFGRPRGHGLGFMRRHCFSPLLMVQWGGAFVCLLAILHFIPEISAIVQKDLFACFDRFFRKYTYPLETCLWAGVSGVRCRKPCVRFKFRVSRIVDIPAFKMAFVLCVQEQIFMNL